eukprot:SAG22_NODE_3604_length_1619_cov_1.377632_2_plen_143_part_01
MPAYAPLPWQAATRERLSGCEGRDAATRAREIDGANRWGVEAGRACGWRTCGEHGLAVGKADGLQLLHGHHRLRGGTPNPGAPRLGASEDCGASGAVARHPPRALLGGEQLVLGGIALGEQRGEAVDQHLCSCIPPREAVLHA